MPFLPPNQRCQSTEGSDCCIIMKLKLYTLASDHQFHCMTGKHKMFNVTVTCKILNACRNKTDNVAAYTFLKVRAKIHHFVASIKKTHTNEHRFLPCALCSCHIGHTGNILKSAFMQQSSERSVLNSQQNVTVTVQFCPQSFWLTLPWRVLSTSWCCPFSGGIKNSIPSKEKNGLPDIIYQSNTKLEWVSEYRTSRDNRSMFSYSHQALASQRQACQCTEKNSQH